MDIDESETNANTNNKPQDTDGHSDDDEDMHDETAEVEEDSNDYGIIWHRIEYPQLPMLYKLSILLNICDWILVENKSIRKLMNSNKKSLTLEPIFADENGEDGTPIRYYLFGSQSLQSCLFREGQSGTHQIDGFVFDDEEEMMKNCGLNFANFECIGIGIEQIKEFAAKRDRVKEANLYHFLMVRINEMEVLEKKKLREDRRKKMRQQKLAKQFQFQELQTRLENEHGNRRSARGRAKQKVSYKEADSEGDEATENVQQKPSQNSNDNTVGNIQKETEEEPPENDEPEFHPSGRPKRKAAKRKKIVYK